MPQIHSPLASVFLLFSAVVLSTFLVAVLWEFWGEGLVFGALGYAHEELKEERWRYVIAATVFVALSLLAPLGFLLRKERLRIALENELKRAAAVFENTLDGVMITDSMQRILAVNRAFVAITGYTAGEVLGKTPSILNSQHHNRAFYNQIWQVLAQSGHWRGEIWNRKKSGDPFPVWESISEVRDVHGELSNYVAVFSDISSIKETQEELAYLANHDPLTDLPNRALFQDRLEHALLAAHRSNEYTAVLILGLDRFKSIIDTLGYPAGDQLLRIVAERLQSCVRETDTIARLGGDEFTLLLERIQSHSDAARVARKLLAALSCPAEVDGHEVFTSASIGISLYPEDGQHGTELIKNADAAMYRAKAQGGNGCRFYAVDMTKSAYEHFTLENSLRRALEREEFVVHYQPQISLRNGEILGAEALIRWDRPGEGMVSPNQFIPVLEQTGLIVPVFAWLLRHTCEAWREIMIGGRPVPRLSVNVSNVQFHQGDLVGVVYQVLNDTGLDARMLELEITESALTQDSDNTSNYLNILHEMGVRIAIDDFGTGYSSLSCLTRYPIDVVKVDRSFINDITRNPQDTALVSAILKMCHVLDAETVAEGVETVPQLAMLRELGCDNVQGYLFARPLPIDKFCDFLAVRGRQNEKTPYTPSNQRATG